MDTSDPFTPVRPSPLLSPGSSTLTRRNREQSTIVTLLGLRKQVQLLRQLERDKLGSIRCIGIITKNRCSSDAVELPDDWEGKEWILLAVEQGPVNERLIESLLCFKHRPEKQWYINRYLQLWQEEHSPSPQTPIRPQVLSETMSAPGRVPQAFSLALPPARAATAEPNDSAALSGESSTASVQRTSDQASPLAKRSRQNSGDNLASSYHESQESSKPSE